MSADSSKFFEKALDKEEQVVYNALTDRKTGRQAIYLRSPVKRLFPATTVQVFSASPVILPISRFPKQAYSVPTVESRMTLLGRHLAGVRLVQAYQRVEAPLPKVGERYCLQYEEKTNV